MSVYEEITQKVLKLLRSNTPPWRKPWKTGSNQYGVHSMPRNAQSSRPYSGINIPLLWWEQQEKGFSNSLWATEKTWKRMGASILKHQTPTVIYLFRRIPGSVLNKNKVNVFLSTFLVYNLDQVWGCPLLKQSVGPPVVSREADINFEPAESLCAAAGARIIHRGREAKYNQFKDFILLPPKTSFPTRIGYYTTKLHELLHWTGHESRLKRKYGKQLGDSDYAFEELVAEMGTCFLCSRLGIPEAINEMPQHASYMKHWLALMNDDEKVIFKAANAATKATEYLLNLVKAEDEE